VASWLDVCHSRYCIKTAKPILKLFRPSGSPIILVSADSCADTQFQGNPLSGGVKYTVGEKLAIFVRFSTEIAVYLGNDDYYGTLIGSHECRIEWYNFR